MFAQGLLIGIACLLALGVAGDVVEPEEADATLENTIYRTAEARDHLMAIYDERLAD